MNIRFLFVLAGSVIGFALPALAQQKDAVDPKIAEQIRVLASKYDEAFNKNDANALAALYTEDGAHGWHGTSGAIFLVVVPSLIHDVRPVLIPDRRFFIIEPYNSFRNVRERAQSRSSRQLKNDRLLSFDGNPLRSIHLARG